MKLMLKLGIIGLLVGLLAATPCVGVIVLDDILPESPRIVEDLALVVVFFSFWLMAVPFVAMSTLAILIGFSGYLWGKMRS